MIFGADNTQKTSHTEQDSSNSTLIYDVGVADFEDKVIRASMERPVIVDFWAPWCGPCKQLAPVLEKAVAEAGGRVLLAKVNMDENQELGTALKIQSLPTVYGFFQGQPIDAFMGLVPESDIKAFINKLIQTAAQAKPGGIDPDAVLKQAAEALAAEDYNSAQQLYGALLQQDESNVQAYIGLVRTYIAADHIDQAKVMVENAPEHIVSDDAAFSEAKTALELADFSPDTDLEALVTQLKVDPDNHQVRYDLALSEFSSGMKEDAVDSLLEIIRRERTWNEDAARLQLLKFFEAMGHADPATIAGRKKLSSLLFS